MSLSTARIGFSLACVLLAGATACSDAEPRPRLPGSLLRERVEAWLTAERETLRPSIGHYGLVFDVTPADLEQFMAQIVVRRRGSDIVMGSAHGIELHGGGVLGLMADYWQPDGRPARLDDRYPFPLSPRPLALREIYDAQARQLVLPGGDTGQPEAGTPRTPLRLPRIRLRFAADGGAGSTEVDAFTFLEQLLRFESDLGRAWPDEDGELLTADSVLGRAWERYISTESAETEFEDHSYLHLPQILLEYARRSPQRDPNDVKQRFLAVELRRTEYGGYEASEALGHYADSLGFILADPRIRLSETERRQVFDWLATLEDTWPSDLEGIPLQHLAHLLRGLRTIERHESPEER